MEAGEFSTVQDLAVAEGISDRFVSRMMRLSYLSPDVLQRLVTQRVPLALSLNELIAVTELPWARADEAGETSDLKLTLNLAASPVLAFVCIQSPSARCLSHQR